MGEIAWRMPQPGQRPAAALRDGLTVADVAEVPSQPEHVQHRTRVTQLIIYSLLEDAFEVRSGIDAARRTSRLIGQLNQLRMEAEDRCRRDRQ